MVAACSRRTSEPPARAGALAVPEIARAAASGPPVIFLGLDGADWTLLDRYMADGVMPNLSRLAREGTSGPLKTIDPPLSPIVWTTMMTGMSPIDHRVLDFAQFDRVTGVKEPITSSERRAPAIWNMASMAGRRAAVFGLWATYPAETIDGLIVSDRLFTFLFKEQTPPRGVVFPAAREAWAREALARAEQATDYAAVRAYLPWLTEAEFRRVADSEDPYAHPVSALRRMLVETTVYRDLSLEWIRREKPDLAIVYLQSTDTVGHVFAPYAPPRQASIPQVEYDKYSTVAERFFRTIDETIGAYRAVAEANGARLMIASDHGFIWGEGRPARLSSVATASAAKWHAQDGMYLVWGPGVPARAGHDGRGGIQQVCATLLSLAGLPPGRDVDGVALDGAPPVTGTHVDYIAHYKPVSDEPSTGTAADKEALANLRALGYIGKTESDTAPAGSTGTTRTPASFNNEGLVWRAQDKIPRAVEAFETALSLDPNLTSAAWNLSDILYAKGQDLERSDDLLLRAFTGGMPDGARYLIGRAIAYQRKGDAARSLKLISTAAAARPRDAELWLFKGRYEVEANACVAAVRDFDRAIALAPDNPAAYTASALARLCTGDRAGARRAFEHSLQLDPAQPRIREYLATLNPRN